MLYFASVSGQPETAFFFSFYLSSDAKVNVRDYHGKMAAHYWSGSKDIFTEQRSHSGTYLLSSVSHLQKHV